VIELLRKPWLRPLLGIGLLVLAVWMFVSLRSVLRPFIVAFVLAYFLNPVANTLESFLERRSSPTSRLRQHLQARAVAVGIITILIVALLVVVTLTVVPTVSDQVVQTAKKVPDYARTLRSRLEPLIQRLNLRYPAQMEEARIRIEETLKSHIPQILSPLTHALQVAFSSLLGFVLLVLHVVVIPVFAVYLLYDMNEIRDAARELVPLRYRDYVYSRAAAVDKLLSAFVRGQITVALMLGTFYAIAFTILGVPMGLLVGYVVAFFNLVPFMATALGLPLVLLLTFVDQQSVEALIPVAVVFVVGHFVESHFITPRIVGGQLGLHPVVMMMAVLAGGHLFGFLGMLVAVPVTAALSVFWADLRAYYLGSDFYKGPPAAPPAGA
jgi:predicted PurR-regulated permease PerM